MLCVLDVLHFGFDALLKLCILVVMHFGCSAFGRLCILDVMHVGWDVYWMLCILDVMLLDVTYFGCHAFGCDACWMWCILGVMHFGCYACWMLCIFDVMYLMICILDVMHFGCYTFWKWGNCWFSGGYLGGVEGASVICCDTFHHQQSLSSKVILDDFGQFTIQRLQKTMARLLLDIICWGLLLG